MADKSPKTKEKADVKPKKIHDDIIELINKGYKNTDICNQLSIKPNVLYYVKRRYRDRLAPPQDTSNITDITNYAEDIDNILRKNILRLGNTIINKDIDKASLSQLTTSFGIMYDKLRLHEGKSTQNIGANLLVNLDESQLELIKETIKSLKESMLNK